MTPDTGYSCGPGVGSSSLTVALYGTPVRRRVVEETGEPPRKTSVQRLVYDAKGKLLYDATFYSSYRGEPTVIRVGTKPRPEGDQTQTTTTGTTTTTTKPPKTTTSTTTTTTPRP